MPLPFDPERTLFIIDGSSFLYRAYYSLRPLHTLQGETVHAVYGFCRMIKKLIDMMHPQYMVLVWDSKGATVRHKLYPDYKKGRQDPPSDIFTQKERIITFAQTINLTQVAQPGVEADDLIYSLAQEYKDKLSIVYITSDKDMAQSLDTTIQWYEPLKDQVITVESYTSTMGFPPSHSILYYSLVGDASDNIPGVRGIGKAGAQELAQQFSSLDQLYTSLDQIKKPRLKNALITYKEDAFLSQELFTLRYHATGITEQQLSFDAHHWDNAYPLFQELNFKSLLSSKKKVAREPFPLSLPSFYNAITVTTEAQLQELADAIRKAGVCALDTETTGVHPLQDLCIGISVCFQEGTAYYLPFDHVVQEPQLTLEQIQRILKPVLEDESIEKYLHNAKYDILALHGIGITLKGLAFDTMVAARLVNPEWQKIGLKALSLHYFNEKMLHFVEVTKGQGYTHFGQVPLSLATVYAAGDAHQTYKLVGRLRTQLKEMSMETPYFTIEHPLIEVLAEMERIGIAIDTAHLEQLGHVMNKELEQLESSIISQAHLTEPINLNSPKQVETLLFTTLQLPPQKKSHKGTSYSTDQEVLATLSELHPVPGLIAKYRELSKLKNTYVDALPTYINWRTNRIHTSFNQVAVATGRLSSADPNLQNIPTDTKGYGIEIRRAFVADQGTLFLSADYSQIELRVLAHLSQDKHLIAAFLEGQDIHAQTAAGLFGVSVNAVTAEQRQVGKRINFSIVYGITPFGLSKDLSIPFATAKEYIDKYFAQYPQVGVWMEQATQEAEVYGYVTTYWGRRRYVPGIYERNAHLLQEAKRIAINSKVQGTAAEIMKRGMIELAKAYNKHKVPAHILLQIHDELLIQVSPETVKTTLALTQEALTTVVEWEVPLEVSMRTGTNWKEITK